MSITCNTSTIQARVGREKQRYYHGFRLVAGCIPYRFTKRCACTNFCGELEVLMISTPNRDDLVFPKGGWENDETVHEAARREALEEAGVRGTLNQEELGVWEFKSKSKENSQHGACRGHMFAMEVTEQLESWPERDTHHRRWVGVTEARGLCRYDWMREALNAFLPWFQSAKETSALPEPFSHFCSLKTSEKIWRPPAAVPAEARQHLLQTPTTTPAELKQPPAAPLASSPSTAAALLKVMKMMPNLSPISEAVGRSGRSQINWVILKLEGLIMNENWDNSKTGRENCETRWRCVKLSGNDWE